MYVCIVWMGGLVGRIPRARSWTKRGLAWILEMRGLISETKRGGEETPVVGVLVEGEVVGLARS